MTTRKRPKPGALEAARVAKRRESEAAHAATPSPRQGTHAHKMWRMLGLPDRPPQPLPRTSEEAAEQMVTPGTRALRALKVSIKAEHEWWKGERRRAGRLKGESSQATRAKYSPIIAVFIRGGAAALLKGPPFRKKAIGAFIEEADGLPASPGHEPRDFGPNYTAWAKAVTRYADTLINFLERNQPWVREQITKR